MISLATKNAAFITNKSEKSMPITWKKRGNLKPEVILGRIASVRTISPGNSPSFSGFEIHDAMPALESMLVFPPAALDVQRSTLVWKAISSMTGELDPKSFLVAVNQVLSKQTATKNTEFHILSALSIVPDGLPKQREIEAATIHFLPGKYPRKYSQRSSAITAQRLPVESTPDNYCNVIVKVIAKSPYGAMTKALRTLDIQRAIWCLMCNSQMQLMGQEWIPINAIRLSSTHTIHLTDGTVGSDEVWFEPNHTPIAPFKHNNVKLLCKNTDYAIRSLKLSRYGDVLSDALLRYVRALDERDQNSAFIRLWGAIEALVTPGHANYDNVVNRCSFLFREKEYHQQILQHLRECRNQSIHAGDQSGNAKTHCFQLQVYFYHLFWFHLRNAKFFKSLDEANAFLDSPTDKAVLIRSRQLVEKAIRFIS